MLHDHDGELEMAEDRNHDDARASSEGEMDARVNRAADSMLSMQLQLAARLNNHLPSVHYSQEGFQHSASATQPKNYNCEISDTSALYLGRDSCSNNDTNQFSEFDQLTQRMNTGELGLPYMRNSIGEKSSLGLSHGHSSQDHGAQCVNLDSDFSQRKKVFSSEHTLPSHQQFIQEPVIIYQFPQEQERLRHLYMMNTYGSTCATSIPSQASKMHIQDYQNIAIQHDFEQDYALNTLTDLIQLQGTAFVKECQPQHVQVHQRHLSLFNSNSSEIRGRASQGDLQELNRQSTGSDIAAWEEINKFNDDMLHQQEQYDQQQAFLNFLRFSNVPHGGSKYCRRDNVDGKTIYRRSKSPEDQHELLELFDGRSSGSVTVAATAVLHSEASVVNVNGTARSLPDASEACYRTSAHIDENEVELSQFTYRETLPSELGDTFSNSVPHSSSCYEKKMEVTTSSCLEVEPRRNTGEAFTSSCQAASSWELEFNYNTTAPRSSVFFDQPRTSYDDSVQVRSLPAVEPRMKQVFRTEKQRRDFIKERYKTLQSLVPRYSKTDRASIVGDTIHYIHVLQHQITELTLKKEKRRERKKIERSQTTGEGCAESHNERPRNYERALSEFRISDENELRLASKHGAALKFQLIADELHVNIVQKREPYFLNRFLASLARFDMVNTSGGIIDNHHIQSFILKIKGNLREVSAKMINNIMETLDQI